MKKSLSERDKWISIKKNFQFYTVDSNWEKAFDLFSTRLKTKYLNPIDNLLSLKNKQGEGFSIVTVQCVLIEKLAAFKSGKIFNSRYNESKDPPYQYKDSRNLFTDFLLRERIFENHFYKIVDKNKELNKPFCADDFYTNVRCALIHEGKTRKNWTINLKPRKDYNDKLFIREIGGKKKIYRTFLQIAIRKYLRDYIEELRESKNDDIRRSFARKMDNIYQLKKTSLDWWV